MPCPCFYLFHAYLAANVSVRLNFTKCSVLRSGLQREKQFSEVIRYTQSLLEASAPLGRNGPERVFRTVYHSTVRKEFAKLMRGLSRQGQTVGGSRGTTFSARRRISPIAYSGYQWRPTRANSLWGESRLDMRNLLFGESTRRGPKDERKKRIVNWRSTVHRYL